MNKTEIECTKCGLRDFTLCANPALIGWLRCNGVPSGCGGMMRIVSADADTAAKAIREFDGVEELLKGLEEENERTD